jgi:hypothetical protein
VIADACAGDHGEPSNNRVKLTKSASRYDGGAAFAAYARRPAEPKGAERCEYGVG